LAGVSWLLSFFLSRAVVRFRVPQARPDEVNGGFRGGDTFLGFLLKGMQHVDHAGETHSVNGAVGVAVEVLDDLEDTAAAESL